MAQKRFNLPGSSQLNIATSKIAGIGLLGAGSVLMVLLVLVLPVWTRLDCDRSITELVSCRLRGANLIGIAWRNQKVMPMVGAETNLQSAMDLFSVSYGCCYVLVFPDVAYWERHPIELIGVSCPRESCWFVVGTHSCCLGGTHPKHRRLPFVHCC